MIRRYAPPRASRGTVIPASVRESVYRRDRWMCVGLLVGFPAHADGRFWCGNLAIDHVRASGALGKKSRSSEDNLLLLGNECHRYKTLNGREARPKLLRYLADFYGPEAAA